MMKKKLNLILVVLAFTTLQVLSQPQLPFDESNVEVSNNDYYGDVSATVRTENDVVVKVHEVIHEWQNDLEYLGI